MIYYNESKMVKAMRILLVEDDENLNRILSGQLTAHGFDVDRCCDGEDALYYGEQNIYDIILLDRMLPSMEGTDVLSALRKKGIGTPVILITALGTLTDKVLGLNMGADDYLVKPFAFEELLARIYCITRRSPQLNAGFSLTLQDISYDLEACQLTGPAGRCSLSKREGALLEVFLRNPGQTLSRSTLLLKVWGPESDVENGNLDNYIHFLRRRLGAVGSSVQLTTVRGVGYCLK